MGLGNILYKVFVTPLTTVGSDIGGFLTNIFTPITSVLSGLVGGIFGGVAALPKAIIGEVGQNLGTFGGLGIGALLGIGIALYFMFKK